MKSTLAILIFFASSFFVMSYASPTFYSKDTLVIPAKMLCAWNVAFLDWSKDNSTEPKLNLTQNFSVGLQETEDRVFVWFSAKRDKSEVGLRGGRSKHGQDVLYEVSNKTFNIIQKTFFK